MIPFWKFGGNLDFSSRVISIWNMPWYRQDVDLSQKQLVTASIATTCGGQFSAARFIMVEWFHADNFVKVMPLAFEL